MKLRVGLRVALLSVIMLVLGTTVSAAPTPGTVHFTAAGDFAATSNTAAVLDSIHSLNSDFTLAVGDLSYGDAGQEQAWCDFVTARVGAGYPFELVSGNHESNGLNGNINDFSSCLPNQLPGAIGTYGRQYYVDVPRDNPLVRFIMISPGLAFPDGNYNYTATSARYQWTSDTIDGARAAGIPWVVAGFHKPCITVGKYNCEPGAAIFNLLLQKKVDLILSGHEHTYQRTNQLALTGTCSAVVPNAFNAGCVVDSDSTFVKGAGSVAAVVGMGGNPDLYDITPDDTEAGYFAAASGRNQNPTYGALDVSATADSLQASFVRAAGGTFTDSFTITKGQTPVNQPPTAALTSNCTDLACTFNGSGSTDPDGTISSYAWTFGDQTTGSGVSPQHSYTSPGTYPIGLTVTDNSGATASTTGSVTVTAPPAVTTYVSDQFTRTQATGFGTAPTGGSWTVSSTAATSVAGGLGQLRTGSGASVSAYLTGPSIPSADLRTTFQLDKVPTGSGLYLSALGRRLPSVGSYVAKTRFTSNGAVALELTRLPASGAEVSLQSAVTIPGLTYTAGDTLNLRLQVTGTSPTTVRAKIWRAGTAEPTDWQRTATDSFAGMQAPGSVGLSTYLSSTATNAPITAKIDELTVTAP